MRKYFMCGDETEGAAVTTAKRGRKPKEVKELTAEEKEVQAKKEAVAEIISRGRRGVTNFQMLQAMKANKDNKENLAKLFTAYPAIFKSAAKYLPNEQKLVMEAVVAATEPEFKVPMAERSRTKLTAPKVEAAPAVQEVAATTEE